MEVIANQRHSVQKYSGNVQFKLQWANPYMDIFYYPSGKRWRTWAARSSCAKCAILTASPPPSCCSCCCRHGAGVVEFHCILQLCISDTSKNTVLASLHTGHCSVLHIWGHGTVLNAQLWTEGACMWPRERASKATTLPPLHTAAAHKHSTAHNFAAPRCLSTAHRIAHYTIHAADDPIELTD